MMSHISASIGLGRSGVSILDELRLRELDAGNVSCWWASKLLALEFMIAQSACHYRATSSVVEHETDLNQPMGEVRGWCCVTG